MSCYEIRNDYFDCKELEVGKKWDGHTEYNIGRLFSLCDEYPEEFKYLIEESASYIPSPESERLAKAYLKSE